MELKTFKKADNHQTTIKNESICNKGKINDSGSSVQFEAKNPSLFITFANFSDFN
ncbi:hypothetical protein SAMN04489724_2045 [Algoriphagus locisalis]|uniref:Uncharacterized protein n=1 Tax=Algoriphagus locisalis TaxID=305507 RepID=A0A1I7AKY8_9BACT|nr:hypothetical protein SAMN04489724_2045 [Algoriphagus locisalis]